MTNSQFKVMIDQMKANGKVYLTQEGLRRLREGDILYEESEKRRVQLV